MVWIGSTGRCILRLRARVLPKLWRIDRRDIFLQDKGRLSIAARGA